MPRKRHIMGWVGELEIVINFEQFFYTLATGSKIIAKWLIQKNIFCDMKVKLGDELSQLFNTLWCFFVLWLPSCNYRSGAGVNVQQQLIS